MVMDPSTMDSSAQTTGRPSAARSAAADLHDLQRRAEEIGRYLRYLLSLKKERWLRRVRRSLWLVVAAILGGVVAVSILAAASVLLCVGIALALNRAFGSAWIGPLVTGAALLALIAGGFFIAMRVLEKRAAAALQHRHEVARAELQLRYGRGFDE